MNRSGGVRRSTTAGPGSEPAPGGGQATVELALLLPFVALALLAVIQVGLVVRSRILVTHAAREGARTAAVGGSDGDVRRAVAVAGDLPIYRLDVEVRRSGGVATVTVSFRDPTDVPLVGSLVGDAEIRAVATMRLETP